MTRVWSLTPLLNELDLLELRLRELDGLVDVHVVTESPVTFAGREKPLHFAEQRDRFEPWLDRIRYVVTERTVAVPHQGFGDRAAWGRENGQRLALGDALDDLAGDDVVILSDLDEIPSRRLVEGYASRPSQRRMVAPTIPMHLYRVGLRVMARQASVLRLFRGDALHRSTLEGLRHGGNHVEPTFDAPAGGDPAAWWGWHMSYFGGVEAVRYKVANAAHPEENIASWLEPATLEACILRGRDHRQNRTHEVVESATYDLPAALREDPAAFRTLVDPLSYPADYDGRRRGCATSPLPGDGETASVVGQPAPEASA